MTLYEELVWNWLYERVEFGYTAFPTVDYFVHDVCREQEARGDTIASCACKLLVALEQRNFAWLTSQYWKDKENHNA